MARPKKVIREQEEAIDEPEVVADGVVRDAGAENPIEDNSLETKPRVVGNWIKVTYSELVALELSGKLVGYDPATCEALVK